MSNSLDAVLAQYEKNKQSGGSTKPQMTSEERMKQYLSIMLPKGTKSGEKRIRIVPTADGSSPFKEVYFHNVQVQGRWQKLYYPDNEEDGVKFWRFKHNWKGDGPIDKIIPIWRNKGDVTDINEGRDLILILQACIN